jgi:diguanylate cyclase (GGDEF)-like protein
MQSEEMKELFWKRDAELNRTMEGLKRAFYAENPRAVDQLTAAHRQYSSVYSEIFALDNESLAQAETARDAEIKKHLDVQLDNIRQIAQTARKSLAKKTSRAGTFSAQAFHITAFLSLLGVCIGLGAAFLITRSVSRSIHQPKLATAKFSERQFDFIPDVRERDEFGMLARSFTAMAQRLARLEVMDLDANPLTRLPGGAAVDNVLNERIARKEQIAFCLVDIDNFKAFNDRYGYARGNEVIRKTAKIIETAIAEHGNEQTFLGHIGGDDFVVIAATDRYIPICETIIKEFDRQIIQFYDMPDREKGYITSRTRQGEVWEFPIMTVSIAVVTNQDRGDISGVKISEIAAEIKEHAKTLPGSLYLADRRRDDNGQDIIFNGIAS